MSGWSPALYLRFADERTRPARDLAERIAVAPVRSAIDLGCGPGNSTAALLEQWPDAEITGLDRSAEMIGAARLASPHPRWVQGEIGEWAIEAGAQFDVVFSSSALQWVPDHAVVFPRLLRRVTPAGALAVQMPARNESPAQRLMREVAGFEPEGDWRTHDPAFYFDCLSSLAARIDLWETEYLHVLDSAEAIVDWYKGTGLRPYLDAFATDAERDRFLAEYLAAVRAHYPPRAGGHVLFPFRRTFLIAYV